MSAQTMTKTHSALEKAKSLFRLRDPDPATDQAWEIYTTNRLRASEIHNSLLDDDLEEDEDEEKFQPKCEYSATIYQAFVALEKDLGFKDSILGQSYRMLSCDVKYYKLGNCTDQEMRDISEISGPEYVDVLTRVYSPTRPVYIDVHFYYQWKWGWPAYGVDDLGFEYRIGFKIHMSPAEDDYHRGTDAYKMRTEKPETVYADNGWRPLAYGYNLPNGSPTKGIQNVFGLTGRDAQDICNALLGPRGQLSDEADEKARNERRRELVNGVRAVLAAAGIECSVACSDGEKDKFTIWELGRIRSWIGREIRRVCGFQLKMDQGDVPEDTPVTRDKIHKYDLDYLDEVDMNDVDYMDDDFSLGVF